MGHLCDAYAGITKKRVPCGNSLTEAPSKEKRDLPHQHGNVSWSIVQLHVTRPKLELRQLVQSRRSFGDRLCSLHQCLKMASEKSADYNSSPSESFRPHMNQVHRHFSVIIQEFGLIIQFTVDGQSVSLGVEPTVGLSKPKSTSGFFSLCSLGTDHIGNMASNSFSVVRWVLTASSRKQPSDRKSQAGLNTLTCWLTYR
jgi:hypothetical protein